MVHSDPKRYILGIYDLDEEVLKSLAKQIGQRFVNDTGNKKYDPFVDMIFGGETEKPYVHFLRDHNSNKLIIRPEERIMQVGERFLMTEQPNRIILSLKISNLYFGLLAEYKFDEPDFYMRITGTTVFENKVYKLKDQFNHN